MRRRKQSKWKLFRHLWGQFCALDRAEKRLHMEALCELYRARFLVCFVPFRKYAGAVHSDPTEDPVSTEMIEAGEVLDRISRAVTVMARYLPGKLVCLPQAMAAQRMLRRRKIPSILHLGVRHSEKSPLEAHAWLTCGEKIMTGEAGIKGHKLIARFKS